MPTRVFQVCLKPFRVFLAAAFLLSGPLFAGPSPGAARLPELPRSYLDTAPVPLTGRVIAVPAGGDLQAALDAARPGDAVELKAGAAFTGNFLLPAKAGGGWVHIRSSAHSALPPPGTRVSPAEAGRMARIVSPNTAPAITTRPGARRYRFTGIEVTTTHTVTSSIHSSLINLTAAGGQTTLDQVPGDIVFERCYIHGTPTGNVRRGISLNSVRTAVVDSYFAEFHEVGGESQALAGWNGPGPFKIVNNHLEGAAQSVLFGGGDPTIPGLVPSDIEIRGNRFRKPLAWRGEDPAYAGIPWSVKNLFELKNARRVLVDGNVFEHNWPHAQNGFAILFTVRNQGGAAPWSVVEDVTFTNNIVRRVGSGVSILGRDSNHPSGQTRRILIKNNLFDEVGGGWGRGSLFQLVDGAADVVIEHNTAIQSGSIVTSGEGAHVRFVFSANITAHNRYGIIGSGAGVGHPTLGKHFPGAIVRDNVIVGGPDRRYPPGNFFPGSFDHVGFVDWRGGDYRLKPSSPYRRTTAGGKDAGADFVTLCAKLGVGSRPLTLPDAMREACGGSAGRPGRTISP